MSDGRLGGRATDGGRESGRLEVRNRLDVKFVEVE